MTTFKSALSTFLLSDSSITAIIGSDGIFSFPAPQNRSLPYAMISRPIQERFNTLINPINIIREEWQIDCIASNESTADALVDAVAAKANNASPTTMSGFDVPLIVVNTVNDLSDLEDDGSQSKAIRKTMQITVKRSPTT